MVSMTITIDPELEAQLREVAAARGLDANSYATVVLAEAVKRHAQEDPDAALTEEERAAIEAGVDRGLADFEAGRFSSAEEFYA